MTDKPAKPRTDSYHKTMLGEHRLHPETQMMSYGYDPKFSEGSVKAPLFLTSTFVFESCQHGKDLFDFQSGRRKPESGEESFLIYTRFNNPNMEMLEDRLALYEETEAAAVFASGMGAISTVIWAYLKPGDVIVTSTPLYGGTEVLIEKILPQFGVKRVNLRDSLDQDAVAEDLRKAAALGRVGLVYTETPANPTNDLVDLEACARAIAATLSDQPGGRPPLCVDNTFLGPVYQKPVRHGADLVVASLTKYVGGHSDLVAGSCAGAKHWLGPVKAMRSALGTQLDAHTCWLVTRSLETVALRFEKAVANARKVAGFLKEHPKVETVKFLDFLPEDDPRRAVYQRQCGGVPGSTLSIVLKGGEAEAFRFLDSLKVIKLAVSLGGTESLASHPASTTHSGVAPEELHRQGIGPGLARISVGIEHPDDLIADLSQALDQV